MRHCRRLTMAAATETRQRTIVPLPLTRPEESRRCSSWFPRSCDAYDW